jgi:hypothetical protein
MTKRYFSHATEDPTYPEARAVCDRCGRIFNRPDLRPQTVQGAQNLTYSLLLVCKYCYDHPAPFLQTLFIPRDPPNIEFPSPELYSIDEGGGGISNIVRGPDGHYVNAPNGGSVLWAGSSVSVLLGLDKAPMIGLDGLTLYDIA